MGLVGNEGMLGFRCFWERIDVQPGAGGRGGRCADSWRRADTVQEFATAGELPATDAAISTQAFLTQVTRGDDDAAGRGEMRRGLASAVREWPSAGRLPIRA